MLVSGLPPQLDSPATIQTFAGILSNAIAVLRTRAIVDKRDPLGYNAR
jgi:hypothetical protein